MNFCFNLWQISQQQQERYFEDIFYNLDSQQSKEHILDDIYYAQNYEATIDLCPKTQNSTQTFPYQEKQTYQLQDREPLNLKANLEQDKTNEKKSKRKRQIKPSPYHNFQKHLNVTIKHMLSPFMASTNSAELSKISYLAVQLWTVFVNNQSSTKKVLHFIFNEFNEYLIKQAELKSMGFSQIYSLSSRDDLAKAKSYLTGIALEHLTDQNIDKYLHTRRIKNPLKFKKYIQLFRKQLEDGFIKKRFTNRSRKQQMQLQLIQCNKE